MKVIELKDGKVRELTHSQFIVYTEQVRAGKSHDEALKYCLNNELNVADFLYNNLKERSH